MPKRGREGAAKASKAKKRAVARYGADAVAKYYAPQSGRSRKLFGSRETGYVDLAISSGFTTSGSIVLLATIAQGTSVQQRVGKKAMYKSIQFRGQAAAGTTATINDCAMMIVYDKRPTGSLPTVADVLDSASPYAMNNDTNSGRFVILMRKDFNLVGNTTTPSTGLEMRSMDFYKKCAKAVVFKAAGTGAIGDIEEGALYLVCVGNQAAGTGAATLTGNARVRFMDV